MVGIEVAPDAAKEAKGEYIGFKGAKRFSQIETEAKADSEAVEEALDVAIELEVEEDEDKEPERGGKGEAYFGPNPDNAAKTLANVEVGEDETTDDGVEDGWVEEGEGGEE